MDIETIEAKLNPSYLAGVEFESKQAEEEFMAQALEIILLDTMVELLSEKDADPSKIQMTGEFRERIKNLKGNGKALEVLDKKIEEYKASIASATE